MIMKNNKYIKIVILIVLCLILLFTAKDNVSAAYSIFSETDNEYAKISIEYENMCENIINKKIYEKKFQDISNDANNFNIMTNIKQEQIITILNEFLSRSSVEASSIDFSEFSDLYKVETEGSDQIEEGKIATTLVSVSFKATYMIMLKFIDEIQGGKYDAAIKSVRVVMNDNEEVYGTIELVFYALKMDEVYE